jgi:hypothetical protein
MKYFSTDNDADEQRWERDFDKCQQGQPLAVGLTAEEIARRIAAAQAATPPSTKKRRKRRA